MLTGITLPGSAASVWSNRFTRIPYNVAATTVEIIAMQVVNTSVRVGDLRYDEIKPTTAATIMAGPAVLAGGIAYIITARKTKASPMDLRL